MDKMTNYYSFSIDDVVTFMVGGIFTAHEGWRHNPRYHHGDFELIICTKGELHLKVAEQDYTLKPNDLLLVPPYTLMRGTKPSPGNVEFYWLHFILPSNTQLFESTGSLTLSDKDVSPKHILIPQQFKLPDLDFLTILIHQLLNTNSENAYDRKMANYFMTMIIINISKLTLNQLDFKTRDSERINRLKEWIRTNLYKSPTVQDMADVMQLNPQYLSRLFKKVVGIPPKQYVLQLKLHTAQALLVKTNLSIKEISANAYFDGEKLFMRQFKQMTGMTPSEYRAQFDEIYHNNQVISPTLPIPEEITKHLKDVPDFGEAPQDS
ncbi:transcriptional regulator, AraC family [Lentilactobacillus otakiensis DSM 19908 = JCM 15040]|nr:transcriptional regulator, AraC family [Lentilactobacillus otakiensis DSM 19908 = JCM 15040]